MQTRTARGIIKRKVYEEGEEQNDNDGLAVETVEDVPVFKPRKRAKKQNADDGESASTSKRKGKAKATTSTYRGRNVGKLAKLLEMPMDIFCEISQHLKPVDLLQLSRSSKSFNNMLTSRSSKPIWRAARGGYPELPDCPPDLSEPEYAKLVFLKECHVCSANRVMKADYELRTRLCRRCRSANVVNGDALLFQIPGLTEELLDCLPSEHSWYMRESCRYRIFFKGAAERIVQQYIRAVPSSLPPPEAEKAKAEFIESKKASLVGAETHAKELEKWTMEQMYAKQHSDSEAVRRRRAAIREKLLGLGYAEEDIPPSHCSYDWNNSNHIYEWSKSHFSYEWNNMLQQPRDLTTRIWNNIRPKLENIIRNYKTFREEKERLSRKNERRKELKGHVSALLIQMRSSDPSFVFSMESAYDLPSCVSLVEENDSRDCITLEKWAEVRERVLTEIREKIEEHVQSLISSISSLDRKQFPKRLNIPENIDKQFLLAPSTYFTCKSCGNTRNYPQLRDHLCYRYANQKSERFAFDPEKTAVAQALSEHIPYDEDECSVKTKRLRCNVCSAPMSWQTLLSHFRLEEMKNKAIPRSHILEEAAEKQQSLFFVVDEFDSDYDDDDDYPMPSYMDVSDYDASFFGGFDYYYNEDDDNGFYMDEPMNGCIIS